jgi:hypothetical protein
VDVPARIGRIRERRAVWLALVSKILAFIWIGGVATTTMYMFHEPPWVPIVGMIAGLAGLVALVLSIWSWVESMRVRFRPGNVSMIPLGAVTSAHAQRAGIVEIQTREDTWMVSLDNVAAAEPLVADLGFAPGQRPITYRLGARHRRVLHLAVGFVAYVIAAFTQAFVSSWHDLPRIAFLIAVMSAVFVIGKRIIRAPVVTVGTDGVWIVTHGFFRRFVPLSEIASVWQSISGRPIRLKLRSGETVEIAGFWIDADRRDAIATHVRALLAKPAPHAPLVLAREGRSVREWRAHLQRIVEGAGYRVAASNDSLADLVGAPGLSAEERVGAALALRVAGAADAPKIRVAAEQCLDPKTRAALEAAARAEVDELAIEKALR